MKKTKRDLAKVQIENVELRENLFQQEQKIHQLEEMDESQKSEIKQLKYEKNSIGNMQEDNIRELKERISNLIKNDDLLKHETADVKKENEELRQNLSQHKQHI